MEDEDEDGAFTPFAEVAAGDDDPCHDAHSDETSCNADGKCTWCKCAALPSQCWTLDNAKKLPPGVYVCDKKQDDADDGPLSIKSMVRSLEVVPQAMSL